MRAGLPTSEQIAALGALAVLVALCTDIAYGILAGSLGRGFHRRGDVR
jgi:hypothetical protein